MSQAMTELHEMTDPEDAVVDERADDGSGRVSDQARLLARLSRHAAAPQGNAALSSREQPVEIHSTTILKVLGCCMLSVVALHLLVMVSWFGFGYDHLKGLAPLFNLDQEQNIPTFFSSLQLFIAAVLLGICAARHKLDQGKYFGHWVGLAVIFFYLSIDEAALLHEKTIDISREFFGASGLLYYAWVIPFGIFALMVLAAYSRFLLSLPTQTGVLFFVSGAIFVAGAIGVELFEGRIQEVGGVRTFEYMALATVEEILEIIGIYGFIYGLLGYLTAGGRPLKMSLVK